MCRSSYFPSASIGDSHVCAKISGADFCYGDIGGPLMTIESGAFRVCGVASFGKDCGTSNTPSIKKKTFF